MLIRKIGDKLDDKLWTIKWEGTIGYPIRSIWKHTQMHGAIQGCGIWNWARNEHWQIRQHMVDGLRMVLLFSWTNRISVFANTMPKWVSLEIGSPIPIDYHELSTCSKKKNETSPHVKWPQLRISPIVIFVQTNPSGGFLRGTPLVIIYRWDCPWNKPASWGYPHGHGNIWKPSRDHRLI